MFTVAVTRRRIRLWAMILAVALLPGTTYFGHWGDLVRPLDPAPSYATSDHDHSDHCHGDVGSCASQGGAPDLSSTVLVALEVPQTPSFGSRVLSAQGTPSSASVAPLSPPPRAV